MFTELLIRGNEKSFDSESIEAAGFIVSRGERMHSMIRGLLAYSVVISTEMFTRTNADCGRVVNLALEDLQFDCAIRRQYQGGFLAHRASE